MGSATEIGGLWQLGAATSGPVARSQRGPAESGRGGGQLSHRPHAKMLRCQTTWSLKSPTRGRFSGHGHHADTFGERQQLAASFHVTL